jgi:hypothetical protein
MLTALGAQVTGGSGLANHMVGPNDKASTIYGLTLGSPYQDNVDLPCRKYFAKIYR